MSQVKLLALVLPMMSLFGCSTTNKQAEFQTPQVSDYLRTSCEALPKLEVQPGEEMRKAILANRAASELVLAECAAKHKGVLKAVGVEPLPATAESIIK